METQAQNGPMAFQGHSAKKRARKEINIYPKAMMYQVLFVDYPH